MWAELVEVHPATGAVLSSSKGSGHRTFDCERCPEAFQPRSSIRRTRSVTGSSVKIISAQAASVKSVIIAPSSGHGPGSPASTSASRCAKTEVVVV